MSILSKSLDSSIKNNQQNEENTNLILCILNEKNKLITNDFINKIFIKYKVNYKVTNIECFQKAMIHVSYLNNIIFNEKTTKLLKDVPPIDINLNVLPLQKESYEKLEFLGDSYIHLIIASYLYKRYGTDTDEGFMTKLRTKIERGGTLSKLCKIIGLNEYAIFARNIELAGGRMNNNKIMEDIFEAFMGALGCEASYEICEMFFINLINDELNMAELIKLDDNYKELLMQYFHKVGFKTTPIYQTVEIINDQSKRKYKMCVKDPKNNIIGIGINFNKKSAEQTAAKLALIYYNAIENINHHTDKDLPIDDNYYEDLSDDDNKNYYSEL